MAYPSFVQGANSKHWLIDDAKIDRASNGSARARAMYSSPRIGFEIEHQNLSNSEKETLEAHYVANRVSTFSFTWQGDGATYTVLYGGPPKCKSVGAGNWSATVPLEED